MLLLPLLLACSDPEPPALQAPPGCGDGVIAGDEACDDGASNSDSTPGGCRSDCLPARCGDGVTDPGEACDDGDAWGGDGCDPACALETGALEQEPNDAPEAAGASGSTVHGALPEGDVDCWRVEVPACGALTVSQLGDCSAPLVISAHGPDGVLRAVGGPGAAAGGGGSCSVLDPADQPGARWAESGSWAVCVEGVRGAPVPAYALALAGGSSAGLPANGPDLDADQTPDSCDTDDDGDGLDDASDTCPDVSNGPSTELARVSGGGFVRTWLAIGPFTTGASRESCRPSEDAFVGEDSFVAPELGDVAGGLVWTARALATDAFDMLDPWGSVPAPREGYAFTRLFHDGAPQTVTLAVGADDGVFAWWNGARVLDVAGCQGVNVDQFRAEVELLPGWNELLFKVRDQGGGWGLAARMLDASGQPLTELRSAVTLRNGGVPDQGDRDGDGLGDVCDPAP